MTLDKRWPSYLLKRVEELKAHVIRMERFTYEFHPDYYAVMILHHGMLDRLQQRIHERYDGQAKAKRCAAT